MLVTLQFNKSLSVLLCPVGNYCIQSEVIVLPLLVGTFATFLGAI